MKNVEVKTIDGVWTNISDIESAEMGTVIYYVTTTDGEEYIFPVRHIVRIKKW